MKIKRVPCVNGYQGFTRNPSTELVEDGLRGPDDLLEPVFVVLELWFELAGQSR